VEEMAMDVNLSECKHFHL